MKCFFIPARMLASFFHQHGSCGVLEDHIMAESRVYKSLFLFF